MPSRPGASVRVLRSSRGVQQSDKVCVDQCVGFGYVLNLKLNRLLGGRRAFLFRGAFNSVVPGWVKGSDIMRFFFLKSLTVIINHNKFYHLSSISHTVTTELWTMHGSMHGRVLRTGFGNISAMH